MRITPLNNRLYDTRDFDKYHNYFAIIKDERTMEVDIKRDEDNRDIIYIKHDHLVTLSIWANDISDDHVWQNGYKIVYGHFYNDQNTFLFKQVKDNKIIGHSVKRCQKAELYHNEIGQLYFSNYYNDVKKTSILVNTNFVEDYRKKYKPKEINYTYNPETEIMFYPSSIHMKLDITYEDEILEIEKTKRENKIIILN